MLLRELCPLFQGRGSIDSLSPTQAWALLSLFWQMVHFTLWMLLVRCQRAIHLWENIIFNRNVCHRKAELNRFSQSTRKYCLSLIICSSENRLYQIKKGYLTTKQAYVAPSKSLSRNNSEATTPLNNVD